MFIDYVIPVGAGLAWPAIASAQAAVRPFFQVPETIVMVNARPALQSVFLSRHPVKKA